MSFTTVCRQFRDFSAGVGSVTSAPKYCRSKSASSPKIVIKKLYSKIRRKDILLSRLQTVTSAPKYCRSKSASSPKIVIKKLYSKIRHKDILLSRLRTWLAFQKHLHCACYNIKPVRKEEGKSYWKIPLCDDDATREK